MYLQTWLFLCFLNSGRTLEMVVSTAQDILFLHSEHDDTSIKTFSDEILALNSDGGSNVFVLQNGGQNQLKISNISAPNFYQQSSHYFPIKIPAVDQVLPYKNGNCFISNQTYVYQVDQSQNLKALYVGQRIQDLALDACEEKLIILDSGKIVQAKLSPNNEIKFETINPQENEKAQLISTFNNRLIYTTKNPKIFHSDGFSLKSKYGSTLCSSHPDKSYNIRKIRVFQDSVFLLDAHNLVIWKYDLNSKPSEVCQLEIWTHLDHAKQPHNMALLNAQQDCISTTVLDHSSSKTSSTGTEYSIDNDTKEKSKGQDQTESKNPCQNFCHHGECHLTSFGNPYCKCESNYSGARCEIELCHNFCLNQGFCQISNTGSPNCTCVQGFMGFRCQFHESQSQLCHNFCLNDGLCQLDSGNSEQTLENPQQVCFCPEGFTGLRCEYQTGFLNYFVAFLCMAGVNMGLMISLIALFVIYCQRRRHNYQSQPQIIKKSPGRARIFSTSSSSGSRRSRSKSGCKPNHANSNLAFDSNSDPHPLDNNCNSSSKSHSCSALLGDDGQVLDLEDCCQMTICEKPCIEASFRKPAQRKKIKLEQEELLSQDDLF